MVGSDIRKTKKIAALRIHVERAIERLKRFNILSQRVLLEHVESFDDIVKVCACICNMYPSLVK